MFRGHGRAAPSVKEIDARTFARARRGDDRAFTALVRHYDDGLRTLAFRLLGDRTRMDDALQEAYVKAYRALPRFRGDSSPGTWLYRIAYNACLDELRRTRDVVDLDAVRERAGHGGDTVEAISNREALACALAELPREDRAALLLVDAAGFDYRAAAEVLGIPEGTVGSRLNRARAALRRALADTRKGASNR
jgi:RNA polymerase sigma-70 factor (ECF subfamily)